MNKVFSRRTFLVLSTILAVAFHAPSVARAQTAPPVMEGTASYQARGTSRNLLTTVALSRVVNYCFVCQYDLRLVLTLSRSPFVTGQGVSGVTIAQSRDFTLAPRTAVQNISFSGRSSVPRGGHYPILLLVNSKTNTIYMGVGFSRMLNAKLDQGAIASRKIALQPVPEGPQSAYTELPTKSLQ